MGTGSDRPAEIREEGQTDGDGDGAGNAGGGAGGGAGGSGEEEEGQEDENFRRLFAAIDFDPSRAPPSSSTPPKSAEGGDAAGPLGWGGWLAVSLNLRASEVSKEGASVRVKSRTCAGEDLKRLN